MDITNKRVQLSAFTVVLLILVASSFSSIAGYRYAVISLKGNQFITAAEEAHHLASELHLGNSKENKRALQSRSFAEFDVNTLPNNAINEFTTSCQLLVGLDNKLNNLHTELNLIELMGEINSIKNAQAKSLAINIVVEESAGFKEEVAKGLYNFVLDNPDDEIAFEILEQKFSHKITAEQRQALRRQLHAMTQPEYIKRAIQLTSQTGAMTDAETQSFNLEYLPFYDSPYAEVRAAAIEVIGLVQREDEIELLEQALFDVDNDVSNAALTVIGQRQLNDPQLINALTMLHAQNGHSLSTEHQQHIEALLYEFGVI
ncbi:HEAT repeat domain-containing protein [Shewanella sp. ENK2]|uniref:HEAT repeat domain-containing protein n=1 Tax=Shewanella sp. ENK2 TaxID=2775245 RepID=UPI0037490E3F